MPAHAITLAAYNYFIEHVIRDGIITEVSEEKTDSKNIIAPCFINAHTHIGDSVLKDPILGECTDHYVKRDLNALVKPPGRIKASGA